MNIWLFYQRIRRSKFLSKMILSLVCSVPLIIVYVAFQSVSCVATCLLFSSRIRRSFDKAFQYAKEGNHFTTAKSVEEILQYP
jgi:hypothetical protein